jgi:hypothetical protein
VGFYITFTYAPEQAIVKEANKWYLNSYGIVSLPKLMPKEILLQSKGSKENYYRVFYKLFPRQRKFRIFKFMLYRDFQHIKIY